MAQFINHFVRVDEVWSYNMIGGLKENIALDMHVISDIFSKVGAYLMARHNFHLTNDAVQYNGFIFELTNHMEQYQVGWSFFNYYFDNLLRLISPSLAQIQHSITKAYPMVTVNGDIEGFVFST